MSDKQQYVNFLWLLTSDGSCGPVPGRWASSLASATSAGHQSWLLQATTLRGVNGCSGRFRGLQPTAVGSWTETRIPLLTKTRAALGSRVAPIPRSGPPRGLLLLLREVRPLFAEHNLSRKVRLGFGVSLFIETDECVVIDERERNRYEYWAGLEPASSAISKDSPQLVEVVVEGDQPLSRLAT